MQPRASTAGWAVLAAVATGLGVTAIVRATQNKPFLPWGLKLQAKPSLDFFRGARRMLDSAFQSFWNFTNLFEGKTPFMYQDKLGYITTGIGNLIDTIPHSPQATSMALNLPWKRNSDGQPASQADIQMEWVRIASRPDLRTKGGFAYQPISTLHLDPADIQALVQGKVASNEKILLSIFPKYISWPADAQAALHSMAWALGPAFAPPNPARNYRGWPQFLAAALKDPPDFATMAVQSYSPTINPDRNLANRLMFQNAAAVVAKGLDPTVAYWKPHATQAIA